MVHDGALAATHDDTSPKAMARYLERLRNTSPRERLARAFALSARVRSATMADIERSMPGATREERSVAFVRRVYGEELATRLQRRLQQR